MGACACAVKNTSLKYSDNQITAEDADQIHNQVQVIDCPPAMKQSLSSSLRKNGTLKEKSHSDSIAEDTSKNCMSITSSRPGTLIKNQKTSSNNSNTGTLANNTFLSDLEEKQQNQSDILSQQLSQKYQQIQKQTARHRNWVFNQSSMLGKGVNLEDNALIQRSLSFQSPTKLQPIELQVGVTYHGEWMNAMRNGEGNQVWEDGSRFQGKWKNNQINGYGKIVYSDGEKYEGEWRDDVFHGHGKYSYQNGHFYEGEWVDGRKQGPGQQVWEDGEVYTGDFKDGFKHGKGCLKFTDGSYYEGEFSCNEINGQGKYVWINSRQYDGEWTKNKMKGVGILKWVDGRYYKGQFNNDKRHGKGEMHYTDGTRYVGNWVCGKENGHGEIYEGQRLKFVGQWKDGKKIKKSKYQSSSSFSR